jgi:hypothetical protein
MRDRGETWERGNVELGANCLRGQNSTDDRRIRKADGRCNCIHGRNDTDHSQDYYRFGGLDPSNLPTLIDLELTEHAQEIDNAVRIALGSRLVMLHGARVIGRLGLLAGCRLTFGMVAAAAETPPVDAFASTANHGQDDPEMQKAAAAQKLLRVYAKEVVDSMAEQYQATRNPFDPIEAMLISVAVGLPLPRWVLVHMIGCGGNMMTLRQTRVHRHDGPGKGEEAKAVGQAFGFGHEGPGRSSKLRDSW